MKLLLENWRLYVESRKNAVRILDNIPRWSIVQMGDDLFWFSGTSFTPLDHIDIGTGDGTAERSARDWPGGVIHMKRAEMLDNIEENPNWMETETKQIEYLTIMRNVCEPIEHDDKNNKKIIHNITSNVFVDKGL